MRHSIIKLAFAAFVALSLSGCATTGAGAGSAAGAPSLEQLGQIAVGFHEDTGGKLQPDHHRRKNNLFNLLNVADGLK